MPINRRYSTPSAGFYQQLYRTYNRMRNSGLFTKRELNSILPVTVNRPKPNTYNTFSNIMRHAAAPAIGAARMLAGVSKRKNIRGFSGYTKRVRPRARRVYRYNQKNKYTQKKRYNKKYTYKQRSHYFR